MVFASTFGSTARPSGSMRHDGLTLDARLEKRDQRDQLAAKLTEESTSRRENALTLTHCHMQVLDRADFDEICEQYSELAATLQQERDAQAREARERKKQAKAAAEESGSGSFNNGS